MSPILWHSCIQSDTFPGLYAWTGRGGGEPCVAASRARTEQVRAGESQRRIEGMLRSPTVLPLIYVRPVPMSIFSMQRPALIYGLFRWLPLANGDRRRETSGDGGSVSGSRDATNSKRNAPAVSRRLPPSPAVYRRLPPSTAVSKWEPLEQTHSLMLNYREVGVAPIQVRGSRRDGRPMFIEHPGEYGCGWWQAVASRSQR